MARAKGAQVHLLFQHPAFYPKKDSLTDSPASVMQLGFVWTLADNSAQMRSWLTMRGMTMRAVVGAPGGTREAGAGAGHQPGARPGGAAAAAGGGETKGAGARRGGAPADGGAHDRVTSGWSVSSRQQEKRRTLCPSRGRPGRRTTRRQSDKRVSSQWCAWGREPVAARHRQSSPAGTMCAGRTYLNRITRLAAPGTKGVPSADGTRASGRCHTPRLYHLSRLWQHSAQPISWEHGIYSMLRPDGTVQHVEALTSVLLRFSVLTTVARLTA
jgi:hypothetical protein